ncbi:MAG: hypothetical protein H7067_08220, partial [Burkholderiales bacterium]|nr:hypothetical protein [Opitutaceae bacterium]
FTLEQLSSLAENGQADADTFYYDAATEAWTAINANPVLMETLFPAKKSLRVKAKTVSQVSNLNTMTSNDRAITVNDMLLAAEGRTEDTRGQADPAIAQGRAAAAGLYTALGILVITAAAYILPDINLLVSLDWAGLLLSPLPLLGLLNLVLALCLGLGAAGAYPTVRFAAMLGFGFVGTVLYLQDQPIPLACSAAAAIGLYFCTVLINLPGVVVVGLVGLVGACGLAQHLFTT